MNGMWITVILCCLEKIFALIKLHSVFQIFYLCQFEFVIAEPMTTGEVTYDYEHNWRQTSKYNKESRHFYNSYKSLC